MGQTAPGLIVRWSYHADALTKPLGYFTANGRPTDIVVLLPFLGTEESFMIDTGASTSWLFPDFCAKKGLVTSGPKIKGHGLGGVAVAFLTVLIPEVDFGFASVENWRVTVGAIPRVEEYNPKWQREGKRPIAGLIGSDLLFQLGAVIDYRNRTITFFKGPSSERSVSP